MRTKAAAKFRKMKLKKQRASERGQEVDWKPETKAVRSGDSESHVSVSSVGNVCQDRSVFILIRGPQKPAIWHMDMGPGLRAAALGPQRLTLFHTQVGSNLWQNVP